MKKKTHWPAIAMGLTWAILVALALYLIIAIKSQIADIRQELTKLTETSASLRNELDHNAKVVSEIMLYKRIEAIWFDKASLHIDVSTRRALAMMTYRYYLRYGSDGDIPIGLDYWKIFAWVELESGFNPSARSKAGAIGLTQIMPVTAIGAIEKHCGISGLNRKTVEAYLNDPITNFRLGLEILIEYQLGFMAAGVANKDDWKLSFSLYAWSTEAVSQLIQAKSKNIPKASLNYALEIEKRSYKYRGLKIP